jgi:hypothetical protein
MIARTLSLLALASALVGGFPLRAENPTTTNTNTTTTTTDSAAKAANVIPGSRTLKTFNFEEEDDGNHDDMPMFWQKVVGRGYPIFSAGKFDREVFRSAKKSFRIDLDGGSSAYRLMPGKILINPAADYFVVAWAKTSQLKYARAEISAWLADQNGNIMVATEVHSTSLGPPALGEKNEKDEWRAIQLYIPGGDNPAAKSLVLQLGLLQPQQMTPGVLGKFALYQQDLKGSAWFDDIVVFQLPRVSIATKATANVFAPGANPEFTLTVSDLGQDSLDAQISITDADGKEVWKDSWHVTSDAIAGKPWVKNVSRAPLPPGLYTASLDVSDSAKKAPITRRHVRFVCLAGNAPPAKEFGIDAATWPAESWNQLPHLLKQTGAGVVTLPAWRRDMNEDALLRRDPNFDALILALLKTETQIIASFAESPKVLLPAKPQKGAAEDDSIIALFDANPKIWREYTSFTLARYAARASYWQLGHVPGELAPTDPRLAKVYNRAREEFANMVSSPKILLPWNALDEFDPKAYPSAALDLHLPPTLRPAQLPPYIAAMANSNTPVMAHIELPPTKGMTRIDRAADFAKRITLARTANPLAIIVDLPMARKTENFVATSQPDELLIVYRTLISQLGGMRYVREFSPGPNVRAFLFDRDGAGTVVVWSESNSGQPTSFTLPLGSNPGILNLWGTGQNLPTDRGAPTIGVDSTPLLLTNVDSKLVELRASFALAAVKIPAGAGSFRTAVKLHNPYGQALTGKINFIPPKGWSFDPPSLNINIPASGDLNAPITVNFPYNAPAGGERIDAVLTTENGKIELSYFTSITSDVVDFDCVATVQSNGQLLITQTIRNISTEPINAQAYALVPGQARQQRYVLDLKPNETTIKRFTFTLDSDPASYVGKTTSVGLRKTDGKTLLTKSVPVE